MNGLKTTNTTNDEADDDSDVTANDGEMAKRMKKKELRNLLLNYMLACVQLIIM